MPKKQPKVSPKPKAKASGKVTPRPSMEMLKKMRRKKFFCDNAKSENPLPQPKPKTCEGTYSKPPTKPEEISCNWEMFQKTMEKDKKPAMPARRFKRPFKRKSADKKPAAADTATEESPMDASPAAAPAAPEVWFDDVDPALIAQSQKTTPSCSSAGGSTTGGNDRPGMDVSSMLIGAPNKKAGKYVAMDCEFVGVGLEGRENALARCSIVNFHGHVLYDRFVKPQEEVIDYRTAVSGVRRIDLKDAPPFSVVQKEVYALVRDRVLVGHAIENDLKALFMSHPKRLIRDTQRYKPFRKMVQGGRPGLKKLSQQVLGVNIQKGEHSSVEDAQATMKLYRLHQKDWEAELREQRPRPKKKTKKSPQTETPIMSSLPDGSDDSEGSD